MYLFRPYILLFLLLSSFLAQGQSGNAYDRLSSFVRHAEDFNRYYPQEKVYLHLDNTGYFLGEHIWFKAYVVTAPFGWLTTLSQTLYVELLAPEGYVVETKKLPIVDGQSHGDFYLDSAECSGYYEIRAYTRWMLNFREDSSLVMANAVVPGIFSRVFPVFDQPEKAGDYQKEYLHPRRRKGAPVNKKSPPVVLDFYPEGGHLVKGLTSVVAFRAVDKEGRYVTAQGNIVDGRGKYVSSFSTSHRGMGRFVLTPYDKHYYAELKWGEKTCRYALPEVEKEGLVMHADVGKADRLRLEFCGSKELALDTLGLILQSRGQIAVFRAVVISSAKPVSLELSCSSLPMGVYQVLLFSRNGRPIVDRKVFIQGKSDKVDIVLENAPDTCFPCEKISLDFQLYQSGKALAECRTFSLAVRDSVGEVATYDKGNIATELLLSSEVRGFIPGVDYYFASDDFEHRQNLDLLLQVQGWSRYPWEKMCGIQPFKFRHPVERGIILQGRLLSDRDGFRYYNKLLSKGKIRWRMYNDSLGLYGNLITDSLGRYRLVFDDLKGRWHINLHSDDHRLEKEYLPYGGHPWALLSIRAQICVDRLFSPRSKYYSYYECMRPDPEIRDYVLSRDTLIRNISLGEAEALGKQRGRIYHRPGVRARISELIQDFMDENFEEKALGGQFILEYLMNRMKFSPGSFCLLRDTVLMTEAEVVEDRNGRPYKTSGLNPMTLYKYLDWYRAWTKRLDSVEIILDYAYRDSIRQQGGGFCYFKSNSYDALEIPDYVMRFTTYPNGQKFELPARTRDFVFDGYADVKEYCSPDYSQYALPAAGDYRRTLYWAPDVRTDSLGRAHVEFYNSSTCRKLKISAETVLPDGRIGVYSGKK